MAYTFPLGATVPPPQAGRVDRFGNPITTSVPPPQVKALRVDRFGTVITATGVPTPQVVAPELRPLLPGEAQGDHREAAMAARSLDPAAAALAPTAGGSRLPLYLGLAGVAVLGIVLLARRRGKRK